MVSPFVVLQKCCKKGHNSIFEVVSVLKKGFNMSYVHVLKVRVLTLIDNGPFFFLLCEQKVSLQAEGRPETENEKPCNGDRIQGIYRQNSLLVLLNHVLTKKS